MKIIHYFKSHSSSSHPPEQSSSSTSSSASSSASSSSSSSSPSPSPSPLPSSSRKLVLNPALGETLYLDNENHEVNPLFLVPITEEERIRIKTICKKASAIKAGHGNLSSSERQRIREDWQQTASAGAPKKTNRQCLEEEIELWLHRLVMGIMLVLFLLFHFVMILHFITTIDY